MKKKKSNRIHFIILVIGTLLYFYNYRGFVVHTKTGDSPMVSHLQPDDFAFFCSISMFYIAFAILVFGHALLWHSPLDSLDSDESEKNPEVDKNDEPKES
jgi:hypothetical protein